jgi:hypothetical protein
MVPQSTFPARTEDGTEVLLVYSHHEMQKPVFLDEDGNQYVDSDNQIGCVTLSKYAEGVQGVKDEQPIESRSSESAKRGKATSS